MNRYKSFRIIYNVFLAIATFSIIASILFYKDSKTPLFIGFLTVAIVSVLVAIFFAVKATRPDKEWIKQKCNYSFESVKEMSHREMLTAVREAYTSDPDPKKNRIVKPDSYRAKPYLNYDVLNNGEIVYGTLVMANSSIFKPSKNVHKSYAAVLLYSTDESFIDDPMPLREYADNLFENQVNGDSGLGDDTKFLAHYKLPLSMTNGKNVYATCVLLYRYHLPLGFIPNSSAMIPMIVSPDSCPSSFVIDAKYWPLELVDKYFGIDKRSDEEIEAELKEEETNFIYGESKMRKLTITRKRKFIECATKIDISVQCPSALADCKGSDDKYYKNAGILKNGKSLTLDITEEETKIYITSSTMQVAYTIPAGTEDVNLITYAIYDISKGNPFVIEKL